MLVNIFVLKACVYNDVISNYLDWPVWRSALSGVLVISHKQECPGSIQTLFPVLLYVRYMYVLSGWKGNSAYEMHIV